MTKTIIFVGIQGSGKGTQVKLLQDYLTNNTDTPVFHYDTGSGFRALIKGEGHTNTLVRETLGKGALQPVFLPVWLWGSAFVENLTGNEHLLIDGSPRSVPEAEMLDTALGFYKREQPEIILLNLSKDEATKRLLARGRSDDTEEGIRERLSWFESQVVPTIEYYRTQEHYTIHEINGDQSEEAVHEDIKKVLGI